MKIKIPISFSFYKCGLNLFISFILYLICTLIIFIFIYTIIFTNNNENILGDVSLIGNITGIIRGKIDETQDIVISSDENLPFINFNEKKEFSIKGSITGNNYINKSENYELNEVNLNAIISNNNLTTKIFGLISYYNNNKGIYGSIKKEYINNYNNTNEILTFYGKKYDLDKSDDYKYSFVVNRIIYNIIINFGQFLTIFFKLCQFKSKKKIENEVNNDENKVNETDEDSIVMSNSNFHFIYNDNSHLFKLSKMDIIFLVVLLIFSIPLPFAEYILSTYTLVPTYESVYIYIMIIVVIIFINKEKIYNHQKLSIIMTILIGIPEIFINSFWWNKICYPPSEGNDYEDEGGNEQGEGEVEEEEMEEEEESLFSETCSMHEVFNPNIIFDFFLFSNESCTEKFINEAIQPIEEVRFNQLTANILFILIKIYLASHLVFSLLFKRRLMEHYFFSPLKVCYLFGFFNLFIYSFLLIINSVNSANTFKLSHNGSYIDTFGIFVDSFSKYPGYMIILIICSTFNNVIVVYIIKFYKLFESILLFTLNDLLIMSSYVNDISQLFTSYYIYLLFIPKYIFFLIYLEVIRLKFFNLDKDLKETIEERALFEMEMIKLESSDDDDLIENDDDVDENISEIYDSEIYKKKNKKKKKDKDKK